MSSYSTVKIEKLDTSKAKSPIKILAGPIGIIAFEEIRYLSISRSDSFISFSSFCAMPWVLALCFNVRN